MLKNKKLKKIYLHPVTSYLLLTVIVIIISGLLSLFKFQTTYNIVNLGTNKLEQVNVMVYNLFSFDGLKSIISDATKNFVSFAPLGFYLVSAIGLAVCEASGFLEFFCKKYLNKINGKFITFLIILLSTFSSLINDIGYVILIPLSAMIFKFKKRNPLSGVCASFAGVAFGYGTSLFVGSLEATLGPYTRSAARLMDKTFHVSLSSNIYIMIFSVFALSIVGTIIMEKIIIPMIGKEKDSKEIDDDLEIIDVNEYEQNTLSTDYKEKRGFKWASIVAIVFIVLFIYSIIPDLPFSGILLDNKATTYLNQIFGDNSYFQDGFTFMISLLFLFVGLAYGIGSKKFNSDKDVIDYSNDSIKKIGSMMLLMFVAAQFIAIVKKTNISVIITGIFANLLNSFSFGGVPFLLICILLMLISDFFLTGAEAKWTIFAPVVVPILMETNISPQFVQFVMRATDSMANGITPVYAYFVIFIGYLNMYNNSNHPITIGHSIKIMFPYFVIISVTWLLILFGWYIIGLPIGPGVYPTL